jgi:hypothetical protein
MRRHLSEEILLPGIEQIPSAGTNTPARRATLARYEWRCDVKIRSKRLHIETRDGDGSIDLDLSREREIYRARGSGDRANLNAWLKQTVSANLNDFSWLKQTVRAYAKSSGTEHSSASSQSKCSTNTAATMQTTGHASVQSQRGRTEKLDMHEGD